MMRLETREQAALSRLKEALMERYRLLDFRVFGSKARGDASPDSDIDVMIKIEESSPAIAAEIDDLVFEINLAHDCLISLVVFSKKELEEGPLSESPLFKTISKEGVRV
jgi:predicted nucleotidyltransferase